MKNILALLVLFSSVSAFAVKQKVSITYSGFENWGRTYYACDFAEFRAEKVLKLFGASQIDIRCSGGIRSYGSPSPIYLTATFETPTLVGNEVEAREELSGDFSNPACGLNKSIVKGFLPAFPHVKVLTKRDVCSTHSSNYSYTFSILK